MHKIHKSKSSIHATNDYDTNNFKYHLKSAKFLSWGEIEVGTEFSGKTVVTPTKRKVEVVSKFSKRTAVQDDQVGDAEGDDYRKWPCICRNYRNNGNKTKALTQHSTRIGVGRTICWIIVRFSRMILYERTSEEKKITSYSIQNEGSFFLFSFSSSSFFLPFLLNNALLVRWPYVLRSSKDISEFVFPVNAILCIVYLIIFFYRLYYPGIIYIIVL